LLDRKERLFRNKADLQKWGYQGEGDQIDAEKMEKLLTFKEAAFTYMLQNETKEVEEQKNQLSFYNN